MKLLLPIQELREFRKDLTEFKQNIRNFQQDLSEFGQNSNQGHKEERWLHEMTRHNTRYLGKNKSTEITVKENDL